VIARDGENGKKVLGFEYVEGPVKPKPERVPSKRKKRAAAPRPKTKKSSGGGSAGGGPPAPRPGSPVPKVPLVRA
jgi:ATP-dependent Clp protease ATP-binding subunit ClpA